jgi:protein SCO1/2
MRTAALLSAFLLALGLGCARRDAPSTGPAGVTPAPVAASEGAPQKETAEVREATPRPREPATTPSIYDLEVSLSDENGVVRRLDAFRGHPVLITMFYGSCASACPMLTSDLKRIEQEIPEPARSDVRILMVSFDARRDTPSVLARLKRERAVDGARWTFASTPDDQARELAGVLGIRYRALDGGEFFHSSVIVLLDRQGRPLAKLDGLGGDAETIVSALPPPEVPPPPGRI